MNKNLHPNVKRLSQLPCIITVTLKQEHNLYTCSLLIIEDILLKEGLDGIYQFDNDKSLMTLFFNIYPCPCLPFNEL